MLGWVQDHCPKGGCFSVEDPGAASHLTLLGWGSPRSPVVNCPLLETMLPEEYRRIPGLRTLAALILENTLAACMSP